MIVELHLLQNFVPSNLNRDDTGAPKNCEFGGAPRARISSQCLKRTARDAFDRDQRLAEAPRARRTKRLLEALRDRLMASEGLESESAAALARNALVDGLGLKVVKAGTNELTEYLVFLGEGEIAELAALCAEHRDALTPDAKGKAKGLDNRAKAAFKGALAQGQSIDVALFGRMIANLPERNVEAACQVAHAISTHRVGVEFDYYTAIDDLKRDDVPGADMIGTIEFNSACYYRYANVDMDGLRQNLLGNGAGTRSAGDVAEAERLAREALGGFLRASVTAVPSGKVNSMAHHNRPSLVLAVVREGARSSLANAFVRPARAEEAGGDLVAASGRALDRHWGALERMYGNEGLVGAWVCALDEEGLHHLKAYRANSVADVIEQAVAAVQFAPTGGVAASGRA